MPLETIGSYAVAGSTGAIARGARQAESARSSAANLNGFAAVSARGGDTGGEEEIRISSPSANVAVYLSPFIRLDLETRLAIVEFRNSQTGAVEQQYPSPRAVKEYRQNLPESSDLLPAQPSDNGTGASSPQVPIIGPGQTNGQADDTQPVQAAGPGTGNSDSKPASASTPPRAPAPIFQAAAAAFGAAQNVLTGGRQLAVA